ncbi:MAG: 50S ribosomal protein L10 [Dehalococcoidia bacterium]|nr:50S ribosomal protein L10 [Dehalococcoidia bacterium]
MPAKKIPEKKVKAVEQLQDRIGRCTIAVGVDFKGVKGGAMTAMRRKMRGQKIEVRVVKNTLTRIAAEKAGRPDLMKVVQNTTAIVFGYGDPAEIAKAVCEYGQAEKTPLSLRGALLDRRVLSLDDLKVLAALPPRAQLVAILLGQIQAPLVRLVSVLNGPSRGLVTVLHRHAEQLQKQVAASAAPAAPAGQIS